MPNVSVEFEAEQQSEQDNGTFHDIPPADMPSLLMAAPSPLKFILPKKIPTEEEQIQDTVQNRPQTPPSVTSPLQTGTGNAEDLQLPVAVAVQQPLQTQPKSARKTKQQKEAELALQVSFSYIYIFFD
jgi:hypothetical protein